MRRILYDSNAQKQILKFPEGVQVRMLHALNVEASGVLRHPSTKTLSGFGDAQVNEIRDRAKDGTFRVVYTLRITGCLYVLHAFQKKSKQGNATPQKDIDLIRERIGRLKI